METLKLKRIIALELGGRFWHTLDEYREFQAYGQASIAGIKANGIFVDIFPMRSITRIRLEVDKDGNDEITNKS